MTAQTDFKKDYKISRTLGEGSFAKVKLCKAKSDGKSFAVKIIEKNALKETEKNDLQTEIEILSSMDHKNIVRIESVYYTETQVLVVMELMAGGELFDRIVEEFENGYSEREAKKALIDIVMAIQYCHSKGVVHRDLKPENILYDSEKVNLKLADFGLAELLEPGAKLDSMCGTPGYVAPEVLKGEKYGKEVDMWSIGVILYILLCGFPPFYDENTKTLYDKIKVGRYEFPTPYWDDVSEDAKDLIKKLLEVDVSKRLTADQVFQHPWCLKEANEKVLTYANENLRKFNARRRLRGAIRAVMLANKFGFDTSSDQSPVPADK